MAQAPTNPLISSKPSDSNLTVSLHPLVLLTASDLLTRHKVRNETGPLAGIILGQQKGREITAEHAFAASLKQDGERWSFEKEWTETRIQQYKLVHQSPALEVVGWFTLCPQDGPLPSFLSLQSQMTSQYTETAILLTLHPEAISRHDSTNGKLPLSIYESVVETDVGREDGNSMQVDGEESSSLRFRSIPYTIDTDETEMIAIDYVAKGAGSAAHQSTDIDTADPTSSDSDPTKQNQASKKPSENNVTDPRSENDQQTTLTTDEGDQIANLNTRLNSVKMLQSRLQQLSTFIKSVPPSYLSQPSTDTTQETIDPSHLIHLRNIQALLTRLSLLTPSDSPIDQPQTPRSHHQQQPLQIANQAQSNDVSLASLLALLGQDVQALSELGRKATTVEMGKNTKKSRAGAGGGGGGASGAGGSGSSGIGNNDTGMHDDTGDRFGYGVGSGSTGRQGGMLV